MVRTKRKFGVYKIELNDKIYVGSTVVPFKNRWADHISKLKKGKHENRHLQNTYNKYGGTTLKFSILEIVKNKEDCIFKEQYHIDTLKPQYNICKIAGSCLGIKRTENFKQKIGEIMRGNTYGKGVQLSEKHKQKISKGNKGKIV